MHSMKQALWKRSTIGALILGGLVFAASAGANERNLGARINDHFNVLAFVAEIHGAPVLARALDRGGDRFERHYGWVVDRPVRRAPVTVARHHRYTDQSRQYHAPRRLHHIDRRDRHSHHDRKHRRQDRRHGRLHARGHY